MSEELGDGQAAVALELAKRFEGVHRASLPAHAAEFAGADTKGEAVIVVAGADEPAAPDAADWQGELAEQMAEQPLRAAVDAVTERYGLKRKEVYDAALRLKAQE